MREMENEVKDPDSFLDNLDDNPSDEDEDLNRPKNEKQRILYDKIKRQKKIDDVKIMLYLKALEKGIPLYDDEVYVELLSMYPYYQRKLEERQK